MTSPSPAVVATKLFFITEADLFELILLEERCWSPTICRFPVPLPSWQEEDPTERFLASLPKPVLTRVTALQDLQVRERLLASTLYVLP